MNKKNYDIHPALANKTQQEMMVAINTDPSLSLRVDPTGVLKLSDQEKTFVENYIEWHSIEYAAQVAGIDEVTAMKIYNKWDVKSEIKRIVGALATRRCLRNSLEIDEIAGVLSSMIMDEYVSEADRLSSKDKITAAKTLLETLKLKAESLTRPVEYIDITETKNDLASMDASQLKELINKIKNPQEDPERTQKQAVIKDISNGNAMEPSELQLLYEMPLDDLIALRDELNERKKENVEKTKEAETNQTEENNNQDNNK